MAARLEQTRTRIPGSAPGGTMPHHQNRHEFQNFSELAWAFSPKVLFKQTLENSFNSCIAHYISQCHKGPPARWLRHRSSGGVSLLIFSAASADVVYRTTRARPTLLTPDTCTCMATGIKGEHWPARRLLNTLRRLRSTW
ncbi:hypothetical protein EVAR_61241_1 [Eumeta japonica]|uniref:Uncharacterized protein n=1 Tax=Eumeta variegata TaxID=151549 RepID=A0A4C1SJW1_EUMVA|nr:hypothetical protein EVAR_61241_1 [Eumeta japonica]